MQFGALSVQRHTDTLSVTDKSSSKTLGYKVQYKVSQSISQFLQEAGSKACILKWDLNLG